MKRKKINCIEISVTQCCDEPKTKKRVGSKDDTFIKAAPRLAKTLVKTHSLVDKLNLIYDFAGRSYTLYCKQQKKEQEVKQTITDVSNQINLIIECTPSGSKDSSSSDFNFGNSFCITNTDS
jgi:hypothetical protein